MGWLSRQVGIEATTDETEMGPGEGREEEAGLNFHEAIDSHMAWRARLERAVSGECDKTVSPEEAASDRRCALGQWIYGAGGERFGELESFQELREEHRKFHQSAGEVLACCRSGDQEGARRRIEDGEYIRLSERVKKGLAKVHASAKAARGQ